VLQQNGWGYKFFNMLFPSLLQGDKAAESMLRQLKRIRKVAHHFDVVAILRGGGGDVGLSCYNDYQLACEIANFPLPVMTGIGHATNETVVEMIAHVNAITPTKLAEFLLQQFHNYAVPVKEAERKVIDLSNRMISTTCKDFHAEIKLFRSVTENLIQHNSHHMLTLSMSLQQQTQLRFRNEQQELFQIRSGLRRTTQTLFQSMDLRVRQFASSIRKDAKGMIGQEQQSIKQLNQQMQQGSAMRFKTASLELQHTERQIDNMSPQQVLKRGYSITLHKGKSISDAAVLQEGDIIQTVLANGELVSQVQKTIKTTTS
jgi:exodeoxyribonuclease VII large subunit